MNIENVLRWIEKADVDYFTQFIKAWIPFNAWYKITFPSLDSDRAIINEIKRSSNTFSNTIANLLSGNSQESKNFKNIIGELHNSLLQYTINNEGNRLTFEKIIIERNINRLIDHDYRGIHYHIEREDDGNKLKKITIAIRNSSTTLYSKTQTKFDFNEIERESNYLALSPERQSILKSKYKEIDPYLQISLLDNNCANPTLCGAFKFTNIEEKIVKGVIEMLYLLRCVLFHGELVPNEGAREIYKYAYEILLVILKKIR